MNLTKVRLRLNVSKECWLLLTLTFLLFHVPSVQAESILLYGISFPISEREAIDESMVRVRFFNEEMILPSNELKRTVAVRYFRSEKTYDEDLLVQFVKESVRNSDFNVAGEALVNGLRHKKLSEVQVMSELHLGDTFQMELCTALLNAAHEISENADTILPPVILANVLVAVSSRSDAESVRNFRAKYARFLIAHRGEILAAAEIHFWNLLASRAFQNGEKMLRHSELLVGNRKQSFHELYRILQNVQRGTQDLASNSKKEISFLSDLLKKFQDLTPDTVIAESLLQLTHYTSGYLIEKKEFGKALSLLRFLPLDWRTPTTHRHIRQILKDLPQGEIWAQKSPDLLKFLVALSREDQTLRKLVLEKISADTPGLLKYGGASDMERVLRSVILLRKDPSSENDRLRVAIALTLAKSSLYARAQSVLSEVKTGYSLSERMKLLFSGIFISFSVVIALLAIISSLLGYVTFRKFIHKGMAGDSLESQIQELFEEPEGATLFSQPLGSRVSLAEARYRELLSDFNLSSGATKRQIKAAYRQSVKELHPDTNPNATQEEKERFLSLTKSYEKILELWDELGMKDE